MYVRAQLNAIVHGHTLIMPKASRSLSLPIRGRFIGIKRQNLLRLINLKADKKDGDIMYNPENIVPGKSIRVWQLRM